MTTINHLSFKVDTADVYDTIVSQWPNYNDGFVRTELESLLLSTLIRKKVFLPVPTTGNKQDYIIEQSRRLHHWNGTRAISNNAFPFESYCIISDKGSDEIVSYSESCELNLEDPEFFPFFSLKFSVLDILLSRKFLIYHFLVSFKRNRAAYKLFLQNVILKYDFLIQAKKQIELSNAIEFLSVQKEIEAKNDTVVHTLEKNSSVKARVLAIDYMLQILGVDPANIDRSTRARFIEFIIGRNTDPDKIGGSHVYQCLEEPFDSKSKTNKAARNHLQLIRNHFTSLDIPSVIKLIDKDLDLLSKRLGT